MPMGRMPPSSEIAPAVAPEPLVPTAPKRPFTANTTLAPALWASSAALAAAPPPPTTRTSVSIAWVMCALLDGIA